MSATICPSCLSRSFESGRCEKCGFVAAEYKQPRTALPLGTVTGKYRIGVMKTNSRQSQIYTGAHTETSAPVIIEEFFPTKIVGRVQNQPTVSLISDDEDVARRFQQGCLLIEVSVQKRPLKRVDCFRDNNTIYSVFEPVSTMTVAAQCERMADNPYYFRNQNGMPMMSINLLDIPPMPALREYNPNQYKMQSPITQPAEPDDSFAGRIITENEGKRKNAKLIKILGCIAAALVLGIGVKVWLDSRKPPIVENGQTTELPGGPEETVPEVTSAPEPTAAPLPEELGEELEQEQFVHQLVIIPAKDKTIQGIPVTLSEGEYSISQDAESKELDPNLIVKVSEKGEVLFPLQDGEKTILCFIVQEEGGQYYGVEAGTLALNVFGSPVLRKNTDLMGLGFKVWRDVEDSLMKDTLVVIDARKNQGKWIENWLEALYLDREQEDEKTGGNSGEEEKPDDSQDSEEDDAAGAEPEQWENIRIRIVDNIEDEKGVGTSGLNDSLSADNGTVLESKSSNESKKSPGLIIHADHNKTLFLRLKVVSEQKAEPKKTEEASAEGSSAPKENSSGTENTDLPVPESDEEKKPDPTEAGEAAKKTENTPNQEEGSKSDQTEEDQNDMKADPEVVPDDGALKEGETENPTKETQKPEQRSDSVHLKELVDYFWLYSTGNTLGVKDKQGNRSEPNKVLEGRKLDPNSGKAIEDKKDGLDSRIESPKRIRLVRLKGKDDLFTNALFFRSNSLELKTITKDISTSTFYVAVEGDDGDVYRVKIGTANVIVKDGEKKVKLKLLEDGLRTRLALKLWCDVGEYKEGTTLFFAGNGGEIWYESLIQSESNTLNDVLNWAEADCMVEIDENGKPRLNVSSNGSSYFAELEEDNSLSDGAAPTETDGLDADRAAAENPDKSETDESQASEDKGKLIKSEDQKTEDPKGETTAKPSVPLNTIRKPLDGSASVAVSIQTTRDVAAVGIRKDDGAEERLVRSKAVDNSIYMVIWKRDRGGKVFTEGGSYTVIYYGTDDQVLGTEQINAPGSLPES